MANLKISQLTDGSPAQSTDQIPVNRAGTNFRVDAGSLQLLQTVTVTLSAAQIKNAGASPVSLIPTPGTNKYIYPIAIFASYIFGTVPYTNANGNAEVINYSGQHQDVIFPSIVPFLLSAQSAAEPWVIGAFITGTPFTDVLSECVDKAFVFTIDSGAAEFAAGDGTLTFTILYYVVSV